jgi:hypothetical protein
MKLNLEWMLLEDRCSMCLRNVGIYLQIYSATTQKINNDDKILNVPEALYNISQHADNEKI